MRNCLLLILMVGLAASVDAADPPAGKKPSSARFEKLKPFFQPPEKYQGDYGKYESPLEFYDGTPVKTPDDWSRRRQEILDKWHEMMGPWPELLKDPEVKILKEERRGDLTQQHLQIEIAPGKTTKDAYLLLPDGEGPFPGVVVVYYDALTGIGQGKSGRDFALQLAERGFAALSLGSSPETYYPDKENCRLQPLSFHAYEAATCHTILAGLKQVDPERIGIAGHSYGGKWAMFASCLYDKFACAAWSDGGIVFDETRGNINYWERWYLGFEPGDKDRKPGIPNKKNPRTGAYKVMIEEGHDLHELHALMAPRPFLVSGGAEDRPKRWKALNHAIAVNDFLGYENRVAMTNRKGHGPTEESNQQLYAFFEHFLKPGQDEPARQ